MKPITKANLKSQIEKFPEQFTIGELVEKLILIEKIESGIKQSKNDEVITDAKLDIEIEKWFK